MRLRQVARVELVERGTRDRPNAIGRLIEVYLPEAAWIKPQKTRHPSRYANERHLYRINPPSPSLDASILQVDGLLEVPQKRIKLKEIG